VDEALAAALRGADLTRHLLAFARRQPLNPDRIALNQQIVEITKLLTRTLGERIRISLDLAPDVWAVTADPVQLEACIINLATNARDAMPNGGTLTIATANRQLDALYAATHLDVTEGDYALIEITDTGSGMTAEVLAQFFRAVLHHQGTGQRHRPWPEHGFRLSEAIERPYQRLQRTRRGLDLPALSAAGRRRGG